MLLKEVITEEDTESSSDYVGETSDDEDSGGGSQSGASIKPGIDLDIGTTLRRILDQDYDLITNKTKVLLWFFKIIIYTIYNYNQNN